MGRNPEKDSGKTITIHAKTPAEEKKICAFKAIHARNSELLIQTTLMGFIDLFLAKHNWPPGNSQLTLGVFGVRKTLRCGSYTGCRKEVPFLHRIEYVSGIIEDICSECLAIVRSKDCVKKEWGIIR